MSVTPRKRRRKGSLGALKGALWVTITRCTERLEDAGEMPPEDLAKLANGQVAAAVAYMKLHELAEIEGQLAMLRRAVRVVPRNGHVA
jgi:hypothetical protein